jgi:hypothetical protein
LPEPASAVLPLALLCASAGVIDPMTSAADANNTAIFLEGEKVIGLSPDECQDSGASPINAAQTARADVSAHGSMLRLIPNEDTTWEP